MKKIIAAAVATAFVAPAFAGEVSVGGSLEYAFTSTNTDTDYSNVDSMNNESYFVINVSEEVGQGIEVGGDFSIMTGGGDYAGDSVYLSGSFGKIELGDTSGAIDGIDDTADIFYVHDNGSGNTSNDAQMSWALPTLVDGLKLRAAYSAEEAQSTDGTVYDVDQFNNDTQTDGMSGLSAQYKVLDSVTLGYGVENLSSAAQDTENKLFNVVYSAAGIRVAYEVADSENSTTGTVAGTEYTSVAVSYKMNDTTFKLGTQEQKDTDAGTTSEDITAYGVAHEIGGLTLYVEAANNDKGDKDELTAVGMAYKF